MNEYCHIRQLLLAFAETAVRAPGRGMFRVRPQTRRPARRGIPTCPGTLTWPFAFP